MKKVTVTDSGEPISDIEYGLFVLEFNLNLPESYKAFILNNNGGYPELSYFQNANSELYEIQAFYCVKLEVGDFLENLDSLTSSLEIIQDHQVDEQNIPSSFYPFGYDSGGSVYCLSMDSKNQGAVFKCYFDGSPERYICDSFEDFVNGLSENDE